MAKKPKNKNQGIGCDPSYMARNEADKARRKIERMYNQPYGIADALGRAARREPSITKVHPER